MDVMSGNEQVAASLNKVIKILEDLRNVTEGTLGGGTGSASDGRRLSSEAALIERFHPKVALSAALDYKHRRLREQFFGTDLFGEPIWDMLLDLFVHSHNGRRTSVSNLVAASMAPGTTGLRYVSLLCEAGLAQRVKSESDKRVTYLELTDSAKVLLGKYYAARDGFLEPQNDNARYADA